MRSFAAPGGHPARIGMKKIPAPFSGFLPKTFTSILAHNGVTSFPDSTHRLAACALPKDYAAETSDWHGPAYRILTIFRQLLARREAV
jgi:hypothetical protein